MVQKRQLAEEEYDVSPKHLKLENSCQLVPCLEDVPRNSGGSGEFKMIYFFVMCVFMFGCVFKLIISVFVASIIRF